MSYKTIFIVLLSVSCVLASPEETYQPTYDMDVLLRYINIVRTQPDSFLNGVLKQYYLRDTDPSTNIVVPYSQQFTEKVVDLMDEIHEEIKNGSLPAVNQVKLDLGLTWVAHKHANLLANKFHIKAHVYPNGTGLAERLFEYSTSLKRYGEIVSRNRIKQKYEQNIIAEFFLDDDVSERGHRFALMKPQFTKMGVGIGLSSDPSDPNMYFVIVFADDTFVAQEEKINCQMKEQCNWLKHLRNNNIADPCLDEAPQN